VNRKGIAENRVFILFTDALAYVFSPSLLLSLSLSHTHTQTHRYGTGTMGQDVKLHRVMYMGAFGVFESKDSNVSFEVRSKSTGTFSRAKAFVVRAANKTEKNDWMTAITNSMKEAGVDSKQQFAAMWSHDTKECEVCDQSFGLIRRRHHCRNCGKCVCSSCSPNQWTLEHVSQKPQRVCNMCYVSIGFPMIFHTHTHTTTTTTHKQQVRLKTAEREKSESQRVIIGENSSLDMLDSLNSFISTRSDVSTTLTSLSSVGSEDSMEERRLSGNRSLSFKKARPPSLNKRRPPSFNTTRPPSFKKINRTSRPKSSGPPPPLPRKKKAPPVPNKKRKPKVIQKPVVKPAPIGSSSSSSSSSRKSSIEKLRSKSSVSAMVAQLNKGRKVRAAPQRPKRRKPKPTRRRPSTAVMRAAVRSEARRLSQAMASNDTKQIMKRLSDCLSPSVLSSDDTDE
jgi:hypothetical protein